MSEYHAWEATKKRRGTDLLRHLSMHRICPPGVAQRIDSSEDLAIGRYCKDHLCYIRPCSDRLMIGTYQSPRLHPAVCYKVLEIQIPLRTGWLNEWNITDE
jgi:hypothetical protein